VGSAGEVGMRTIYIEFSEENFITLRKGKGWISCQIHCHFLNFDRLVTIYIEPEDRNFFIDVQ